MPFNVGIHLRTIHDTFLCLRPFLGPIDGLVSAVDVRFSNSAL
jgi:hypothetical protein